MSFRESIRFFIYFRRSGADEDTFATRSGYRIRALTAAEKEIKVSQIVARQREWEDGLVSTYKKFLEVCEHEVTGEFPRWVLAVEDHR